MFKSRRPDVFGFCGTANPAQHKNAPTYYIYTLPGQGHRPLGPKNQKSSNRFSSTPTVFWVVAVAISILGLSYASVPLYQLYCQNGGWGGFATARDLYGDRAYLADMPGARSAPGAQIAVPVHFVVNGPDGHNSLSWSFKPTVQKIAVYPGDTALTFFVVSNTANEAKSGIFTYHIQPAKAGIYFNKIQCFCFEEQRLKAGETIEMPVLFYIDPDFERDPKMRDVDSITLAYVLMGAGGLA